MGNDTENNRPEDIQEAQEAPEQANEAPEAREGSTPPGPPPRYYRVRNVKIGPKAGYMLRKIGQAYMVVPTGPRMKDYQGMITLNETGAFLFKESQKPEPTKQKLIDACKAEYGASDEEALEAVDAFVLQCAECGLFEDELRVFDFALGRELTQEEIRAAQQQQPE